MLASVFASRVRFALYLLAGFGVVSVHPTWARSVGMDVWNVPALHEQMQDTRSEADRLEAEDAELRRRIAVKDAIARDLVTGRITLTEAVDQFAELTTSLKSMAAVRGTYPGATDREKIARHTLAYALAHAAPAEQAATADRLEAELARALPGRAAQ